MFVCNCICVCIWTKNCVCICTSRSNYQDAWGEQIFLRSDASWSKPFVLPDRDCVTTLQPDVTDVLIIIATICCSATSDRPFERNWIRSKLPLLSLYSCHFLLLPGSLHIPSLIFSRARHWRHWGSWLLPPRSFPYDPLPRHAAWNWYLGTGTARSRQGIFRAV